MVILRIGKRLRTRQEIVATAIIYFKRFYINYLLEEMKFYLVVYHPYQVLIE
ncbi:hypothetical protein GGI14_000125 [Coemansia sp. S680]|nr:hypothetical protein GGI14_000125 [Coemansia sp. S680]